MSRSASMWLVVAVAGPATYLTRASFILVAHRFAEVPPRLAEALRMIPPAVLAALTVPAILRPHGGGVDLLDARFAAGALAFLIAWRTKNLFLTTVAGLTAVTLLEQLGLQPLG